MTGRVDIRGLAEFPQGRTNWPSPMAFHEALVHQALRDAGAELKDVDILFTVEPRSDPYLVHAIALAERLRIQPQHCWSYISGGCAPITMLQAAHDLIESGRAKTAVIVAADTPLTTVSRDKYVAKLAAARSSPIRSCTGRRAKSAAKASAISWRSLNWRRVRASLPSSSVACWKRRNAACLCGSPSRRQQA